MTVTGGHQVPMRCANCKGEFHGVEKNILNKQMHEGRWVVLCMCDNCLKERADG